MPRQDTPRPSDDDQQEETAYVPDLAGKSKAKRNRGWEAAHRSQESGLCAITFRYLPVEIRDRINELAAEYRVSRRDEIARLWLQMAFNMDQAGEIDYPEPEVGPSGKLTFFPEIDEL